MCPEPPQRQGAGAQEAPEPRGRKLWALGGHRRTGRCIEAQLEEDGAPQQVHPVDWRATGLVCRAEGKGASRSSEQGLRGPRPGREGAGRWTQERGVCSRILEGLCQALPSRLP